MRTPIWPIQKLPKGLTVSTQVFRHEQCFGPLHAALVWDSETRTQSPLMQAGSHAAVMISEPLNVRTQKRLQRPNLGEIREESHHNLIDLSDNFEDVYYARCFHACSW